MVSLLLYVFLLGNILIISGVSRVSIQLFKRNNFTDLFWQSNSTADCNNIPASKQALAYSIKTETCFVIYNHPDCYSTVTAKYMPGDIHLSATQMGRSGYIQSFHICNEEEGSDKLNVDIVYQYTWRTFRGGPPPEVLESYKNVCSCVNVPEYVHSYDNWSINNHHNAMLAYFETDCSENMWSPKFIASGRSPDSANMQRNLNIDRLTNTTYKIQSFGPNPHSPYFYTSCLLYLSRVSSDNKKLLQIYNQKVVDQQNQIALIIQNQSHFQSGIENSLKNYTESFTQLNEKLIFLQAAFQNLTQKIKLDLNELLA